MTSDSSLLPLRVALGEYDTGWHDRDASLARAAALVDRARHGGAGLVILPEMCTTGFVMNPAQYAETLDGPSATRLREIARQASLYLIAGIATRSVEAGRERFYNSAVFIAPDGSIVAEYRKQRLFAYAREDESYSAGSEPVIVSIGAVRLGLFICFDLRFPDLFQAVAPRVDGLVVIANWPVERQSHWDTLLRARAIESQAYVAGVNRTGRGGRLEYAGGSVLYGPWGEVVAQPEEGSLAIGAIDRGGVTQARTRFPIVPDRRRD